MNDPQNGSRLVTINKPDGTERYLPKLAPSDWARLGNTLRASRKAELREELQQLRATPQETREAMEQFDRRPMRYADVEAFANTLPGQYATIMLALQREKPDASTKSLEDEFNALSIPPEDWVRVTADMLDLQLRTVPTQVPTEGGAGNQNPTPPPASEAKETSEKTPT